MLIYIIQIYYEAKLLKEVLYNIKIPDYIYVGMAS